MNLLNEQLSMVSLSVTERSRPGRREFLAGGIATVASMLVPKAAWASAAPRPELKSITSRIGDIEVARVYETTIFVKASSWFPDLEEGALAPYLPWLVPHYYDPATGLLPMPIQSWILRSAGKIVLIDTGFGNDKIREGYPEADRIRTPYLARMKEIGIRPEDVDVVICTHLHLDHSGWNTLLEDGRWTPTFPNARYIWSLADQKDARQLATGPNPFPFTRGVYADSIKPIIESGQAQPITGDFALDENILLRPTPGHSPGTLRVDVTSGDNRAVFCGDMLHSPLQIPLWNISSAGDFDKDMAAKARHELLSFCAEKNAVLVAGHFAAPHVARIYMENGSFLPKFGW